MSVELVLGHLGIDNFLVHILAVNDRVDAIVINNLALTIFQSIKIDFDVILNHFELYARAGSFKTRS